MSNETNGGRLRPSSDTEERVYVDHFTQPDSDFRPLDIGEPDIEQTSGVDEVPNIEQVRIRGGQPFEVGPAESSVPNDL